MPHPWPSPQPSILNINGEKEGRMWGKEREVEGSVAALVQLVFRRRSAELDGRTRRRSHAASLLCLSPTSAPLAPHLTATLFIKLRKGLLKLPQRRGQPTGWKPRPIRKQEACHNSKWFIGLVVYYEYISKTWVLHDFIETVNNIYTMTERCLNLFDIKYLLNKVSKSFYWFLMRFVSTVLWKLRRTANVWFHFVWKNPVFLM